MTIHCPGGCLHRRKALWVPDGNADYMRHIVLALIALIALGGLLPAAMGIDHSFSPFTNPLTQLTTPSQNAFLNDSWTPSSFVPPLAKEATAFAKKAPSGNNSTSTTYAIYDFLNNNTTASSNATLPTSYTVQGGSMYQFLSDAWTPSTPLEPIKVGPYKKGAMS